MINFINKAIKFDESIGRSKDNFFNEDYTLITKTINDFKKQGFRVFLGGGNMFFMKVDKKLDSYVANCMQVRGLARRKITIKEMI